MLRVLICLLVASALACGSDAPERPRRTEAPAKVEPVHPPIEPRVAAIGDTTSLAPPLQRAFAPAGDFTPMPAPAPGDWLAEHPEAPQSYADFVRADTRVPGPQRNVIYLLPIGAFPAEAPSLTALSEIVHAFYALEVRTLPAVALNDLVVKSRINDHTKQRQLLAPDVLRALVKRLPDDAFGLMAVTMEDLYPEPAWNFVFGMASLSERVGVQSFARQDPAFFGEPRAAGYQKLALRRATWTLVHEIGHMFGLTHCTYWRCVMAGSNNQTEADLSPLHPCPVCLRKLFSAIGFEPGAREEALAKVLRAHGIEDEATWSQQRALWIREGARAAP